jgi:hypothetical protein
LKAPILKILHSRSIGCITEQQHEPAMTIGRRGKYKKTIQKKKVGLRYLLGFEFVLHDDIIPEVFPDCIKQVM